MEETKTVFRILGDDPIGETVEVVDVEPIAESETPEVVEEVQDVNDEITHDDLPQNLPGLESLPTEEEISDIIDKAVDFDPDMAEAYTDEDKKIIQGLKAKSVLNEIDSMRANIASMRENTITKPENDDKVYEMIQTLTLDEIKAMNLDQIDALYEKWGIDVDKDNINYAEAGTKNESDEKIFRKDILIFYRELYDADQKYEEDYAKYQKEMEEVSEELDAIISEYGGLYDFIESKFKKMIEGMKGKVSDEEYEFTMKAFEGGLNLDFLHKYLESSRSSKLLWAYTNEKESQYVYRKYLKACPKINFKADITKFIGLERKYLSKDEAQRPNIILFSIIHYVANMVPKMDKAQLRVAQIGISRFHINLVKLFRNEFKEEEERTQFINALKRVIELIG